MATSAYLHHQLRAYNESWSRDHAQAMACWELESRIRLAITFYDLIEQRAANGAANKSADGNPARDEEIRDLHALYSEWFAPSSEVLNAVAALEAQGYHVEGAEDFRARSERAQKFLVFAPDRVIQSLHDLAEGKYRPLAEVRDELRRRSGTSGDR
jgi:hypothetical protein